MNELYEEVHRRRYERYLRREAQRRWEAERPKRIAGYIAKGIEYVLVAAAFYAYMFALALWASM